MNYAVRSWNRSQRQHNDLIPDVVQMGDIRVTVETEEEMAQRKRPVTSPVLDNSAGDEKSKVLRAMEGDKFDNVIRAIRMGSVERALAIKAATWENLKRLRLKRDLTKAICDCPCGSDQCDVGTLVTWMSKIQRGQRKAVAQLVAIDATCCDRCK